MPKSEAKKLSVFDMPLAELERRVDKVESLLIEAQSLLPGLRTMTEDDRRHTNGKLRSGESAIFLNILAAIRAQPSYFASLADEDEGEDPNSLEVELIADRLSRRDLLARVQSKISTVEQPLADSVLHLGEQTRTVLLAAYRIARTLARSDRKLRDLIAPVIDYYGSMVRRPKASDDKPQAP